MLAAQPHRLSVIVATIQAFTYIAIQDGGVDLSRSNFEHLPELKILNITRPSGRYSKLFICSSQQNVRAPLANLQVLKINVE